MRHIVIGLVFVLEIPSVKPKKAGANTKGIPKGAGLDFLRYAHLISARFR